MRRKYRRKRKPIEISSLIDILFILLIFLMVSVRFTESRSLIELNLPKSEESQVGDFEDQLTISVKATGLYYLNGVSKQKNEILNYLKFEVKNDPKLKVILEIEDDARFGDFFEFTNLLKNKLITNIHIATKIK